jgi:RNA polymerase sigma-70 factor (ECF subfamily)
LPSPPDPFLRQRIEACLAELKGQPRAAVQARLTSGGAEADEQLALRLGMRLNTFLQNVTRARRLLAACLERSHVLLAEAWR